METAPTNGNGASRIGLYLSIAISVAFFIGMLGSVFYVGFATVANDKSLTEVKADLRITSSEYRALQLRVQAMEVSQNEIETQFCAQDIVRNLMHANDMRSVSILWDKAGLGHLPTDNAYYPTICNRRTK